MIIIEDNNHTFINYESIDEIKINEFHLIVCKKSGATVITQIHTDNRKELINILNNNDFLHVCKNLRCENLHETSDKTFITLSGEYVEDNELFSLSVSIEEISTTLSRIENNLAYRG